jgi:hypothetical protein
MKKLILAMTIGTALFACATLQEEKKAAHGCR